MCSQIWDLLTQDTGEGNGNPLQYSCLENPMDGGTWWAAVHGIAKSRTWLSDFTFTFHFHALEKEMATHSSVLAWRIPGTAEPGCRLWGHTESDTTEVTATAAAAATQDTGVNWSTDAMKALQFYRSLTWVSRAEISMKARFVFLSGDWGRNFPLLFPASRG